MMIYYVVRVPASSSAESRAARRGARDIDDSKARQSPRRPEETRETESEGPARRAGGPRCVCCLS